MELMAKSEPFNFDIVFGFTDSVFVRMNETDNISSEDKIKEFSSKCKEDFGIIVEIKNVFQNSIFYGKKNRFVGWTGNENEEPIVKGLDGLADSNPLWIRKWIDRIITEIIKKPTTRFENIPKLLEEAIFELEHSICISSNIIEKELKFKQRLKKHPNEYNKSVRAGLLGKLLEKDKGEEIYWFETNCKNKDTNSNYSIITPSSENINLLYYKKFFVDKLKDTLEIIGLDLTNIKVAILGKIMSMNSYLQCD